VNICDIVIKNKEKRDRDSLRIEKITLICEKLRMKVNYDILTRQIEYA
jgi:hypothetical protein